MARILSVSYDAVLMRTRQMMFERAGHTVVSSSSLSESLAHCAAGGFDILILGHSLPVFDKQELAAAFKHNCRAPIISLSRTIADRPTEGADFHIEPHPEGLMRLVDRITESGIVKRSQAVSLGE